jgi:hypothetical protein
MDLPRKEAFVKYLEERSNIRRRKAADDRMFGDKYPWTMDPILGEYKFTNVFRHHDKTSSQLRELFYDPHFFADKQSILMNCALFRYFGTWEFAEVVGWQNYETFDFEGIKKLAKERLSRGERVFTGAYVITNQGISEPKPDVVINYFLKDLWENVPELVSTSEISKSWKTVSDSMRTIKGFGGTGFMTKEILIDTTYTSFWSNNIHHKEDGNFSFWSNNTHHEEDGNFSFPDDWDTWTPIGPGALRGASRLLGSDDVSKPVKENKARAVIDLLKAGQIEIDGVPLSPTDIQFGLCEFDKYERVRLGQGRPRSKYKSR